MTGSITGRREPPRFRQLNVVTTRRLGPLLTRVILAGRELDGFAITEPAASVRLLLPAPGSDALVIPVWNGNEFLMEDGSRPFIRTFTPRRLDADGLALDLVIHEGGAASGWIGDVALGALVGLSGPGRGYALVHDAPAYVLAGDETAIPAISQLLEYIPVGTEVTVQIEVRPEFGSVELPTHPRASVTWHELAPDAEPGTQLESALRTVALEQTVPLWVAGEAAAMHRIRQYVFNEVGIPRSAATIRGYWKKREN